jgi:hypothetical protein
MKVVMTLLVRDEDDIVEANLAYHLHRGVDFVIATDNGSRDGTRAILERYADAGVLQLIDEPGDDYSQHRWVTRMARLAATQHGADWVVHNDADQFWWPEQGSLKDVLAAVPPEYGVLRAAKCNFVARREVGDSAFFADALCFREVLPESRAGTTSTGRPVAIAIAHRGVAGVTVAQGNHSVDGIGLPALPPWAAITLWHFPERDYARFETKIVNGGRAYARNQELPTSAGRHWRDLYERYQAGALRVEYAALAWSDEELQTGLEDGRLVVDRRLQEVLASWHAASDDGRYTFGGPQTSPLEEVQPPTDLVRSVERAIASHDIEKVRTAAGKKVRAARREARELAARLVALEGSDEAPEGTAGRVRRTVRRYLRQR